MRRFRFLFLLFFFILIVIPSVVILLSLEKNPSVHKTSPIDTDKASRAKNFSRKTFYLLSRNTGTEDISISASEEDINSLMAVMASGINRVGGHVEITGKGLHAALTFRLPHNPAGDFINLRFTIYPSGSGLHISPVTIGHIEVPDRIALFIIRFMLDTVLGNKNGTVILNSVQSVVINNDTVTFNILRIPDIMDRRNRILLRFESFRDVMPHLADPEVVRSYYIKLMELGNHVETDRHVSLAYFMGPLFELAKKRSLYGEPAEENKAALLALAIFTGDARFEKLIGDVRTQTMKTYRPRYRLVLLGGRDDLRLHFVISIGLKIVSDSGITYAAGEFKELLDARKGGSGFSFVDIAADIAGTRLAEAATDRSGGAERVQSVLAGQAREHMFFPKVSDLPEDIEQDVFENTYGDVENPKYLKFVETIKDRISRLPVYREG